MGPPGRALVKVVMDGNWARGVAVDTELAPPSSQARCDVVVAMLGSSFPQWKRRLFVTMHAAGDKDDFPYLLQGRGLNRRRLMIQYNVDARETVI